MTNEKVRPIDVQPGDRIATKAGTWFTVKDVKNTLVPKEGWPEDPSINPSHWVVFTFTSDDQAPYSFRDDEEVERART